MAADSSVDATATSVTEPSLEEEVQQQANAQAGQMDLSLAPAAVLKS